MGHIHTLTQKILPPQKNDPADRYIILRFQRHPNGELGTKWQERVVSEIEMIATFWGGGVYIITRAGHTHTVHGHNIRDSANAV
jgi:hypothetical protein